MEANRYVNHPFDGTSVDLYVDFNDSLEVNWYKVITIWDETGHNTIDPAIYDLSWLNAHYINENSASA